MGSISLVLLILVSTNVVFAVTDYWVFSDDLCTAGAVQPLGLPDSDDQYGSIFLDFQFTCEGQVSKWNICVKNTGVIYLSVWRKESYLGGSTELGSFTHRGANRIAVTQVGCQEFLIPNGERIYVGTNDYVGVYYDSTNQAFLEVDKSGVTGTTTTRVLQKVGEQIFDQQCPPQVPITGPEDSSLPSIEAQVIGAFTDVRLVPENEYRQGRPELEENGVFGTICDKWVHYLGWPNTFCRQLGFPFSDAIAYTRDISSRFHVDSGPISLFSPRFCKASNNLTMDQCPEHPNGGCDHDLDVFVRCEPKVRCRTDDFVAEYSTETVSGDEKERVSCIPEIFLSGCFGHFCDTISPCLYKAGDLRTTWMSAFCYEIGYTDGAVDVDYASSKFSNYYQNRDILSYNPRCTKTYPFIIDDCPPGIINTQCDHNCDFWITCQRPQGYQDPYETTLKQSLNHQDAVENPIIDIPLGYIV